VTFKFPFFRIPVDFCRRPRYVLVLLVRRVCLALKWRMHSAVPLPFLMPAGKYDNYRAHIQLDISD